MTRRHGLVLVAATAVTFVALALLVPSTSGVGHQMDEGAVVAYASQVLDGAIPHRDFLTFYGPGNPWLVAGAFVIGGENVATERTVGLLYRLLIVLSLFTLALRLSGVLGAVLAGALSAWVMSEEIVWAYATYGAIAFGLAAIALATAAGRVERSGRHPLLLAAGLAAGVATLMRFDFAPAVLVSAVPLLALVPWRARAWFGAGVLVTAGVYVPHVLLVGWPRLERLVGDLSAAGRARRLPLPALDTEPGYLFAASVVVSLGFVLLGAGLWRRGDRASGPVLVALGLFSCALVPWTMFRADILHVRPFALVPLSMVPAVALVLLGKSRPGARGHAVAVAAVVVVAMVPVFYDLDIKIERARDLRGLRTAERGFYDDDSVGAKHAVERLRALAQPGDRLFVGMKDLRRAEYGPTFMYFLLRDLEPASYYMEMNPGTANREGSGLADELRRADWLILTTEYDFRHDSDELGPSEPNEVVRDEFCLRLESRGYFLYGRCDPGETT